MKKRLCAVLGAIALLGALAPALAASPASAAATSELKSVVNTHCVDEIANASHTIDLTSCEKAANQEWTVASVLDGLAVRFQNASTGACLADRGGAVQVTGCNPSSLEQAWIIEGGQIESGDNGDCLTQSGFQVTLTPCSGSSAENWELTA
jgi:hypothetical protein